MRLRSLLFTPANGGRKVEKAFASEADAVILDLEDAVAVAEKPAAREHAVAALRQRGKPAFVRVNALSTPHCFDDLLAIVPAAPDGIILPKVEHQSDVRTAEWAIGELERRAAGGDRACAVRGGVGVADGRAARADRHGVRGHTGAGAAAGVGEAGRCDGVFGEGLHPSAADRGGERGVQPERA
jgi:citrate lyase subunit beta/citryl-CoA lyase